MGRIKDFAGVVKVEVCGTMPESFLNACALAGLELWQLRCIDDYTIELCAAEKELPQLENLAAKTMCSLKLLETRGGSKNKIFLKRKAWLLLFVLTASCLALFSSLFIWEIEIHGNELLSEQEILRELADCGVSEGKFWPHISADLVRSRMLTKLPELSWMTVNISGSRAIVLVRERMEKPEIYKESNGENVVASQGGIIKSISVLNGQALVSAGQTVSKGQLLVSGVVEGINGQYSLVSAKAEVKALTCHEIKAVYPSKLPQKTALKNSRQRFALIFGKKRINLYLNSRNTMLECDKIITEYNLGLDGLFALPVTVVKEELRTYRMQDTSLDLSELISSQQLEKLAGRIDGELEHSSFSLADTGELCYVTVYAHCLEDIARCVKIQ